MNLFAWSGLILTITIFPLGIFVFLKNKKSKINKTLALFCFAGALWGLGALKIALTPQGQPELALIWWKIAHIGIILMPVFLLHFIFIFLNLKKEKLLYLVYFLGIFFLFINFFTDLFISQMKWVFNSFYWDSPPGLFYYFFVAFFFLVIVYCHYELFKAYKKSIGIKRTQIRYIFLAALIGFSGGGTSFLPCFGINFYPIFNFATPLYPLIMSYAIIRYRLMDIRLVLGRGAIYALSFTTIVSLAFALMFLNNQLNQPLSLNISGSLIIIISLLAFQPTFRFFSKIGSKYFYYTFYNYQNVLADLGKKISQVLDLNRLSFLIVNTLIDTMKLDRAVILLRNPETKTYQVQKNIGFREENGIMLVKDNFLTEYLQKTRKPLVYEELSLIIKDSLDWQEKKKIEELKENMKKIEASLCLPLLIKKEIIGMIVLGNKISRDSYSKQDINLLTDLTNQASIALQNARLYSEVDGFAQRMEREVEERTTELRKAYEELKTLDKAKSEFISMASHQLRTPLSAIKGYISMISEGFYGKIPKKVKDKLGNVFESNERLIQVVNELLNISKIELGKTELDKKTVQIEDLIEECYKEMEVEAKRKKIKFVWNKPKRKLPKIQADFFRLRQVFLNLIDNALKYTNKGKIEIKAEKIGSNLKISFTDTGEGLEKGEKEGIFGSFTRGKAGINYWVEGSGFGLYLARKYVEMHKGRIWAESKGKGQGSTFCVELPVSTQTKERKLKN
jgi:signal transduction histidine kinase